MLRLVRMARAKEFVMFAEAATAEELRELGVVHHVRLAEEVLSFVRSGSPGCGRWTTARCR